MALALRLGQQMIHIKTRPQPVIELDNRLLGHCLLVSKFKFATCGLMKQHPMAARDSGYETHAKAKAATAKDLGAQGRSARLWGISINLRTFSFDWVGPRPGRFANFNFI